MKKILLSVIVMTSGFIGHSQNLSDSLLIHYFLDGNATDHSGNSYHGLINNTTATTDRHGNPNGAIHFNGVNSYIDLPNIAALKPQLPLTVAMWVKMTNADDPTKVQAFHNDHEEDNYNGIFINTGGGNTSNRRINIGYGDGTGIGAQSRRSKRGTTDMPDGVWKHVTVVVRGPQDMDIYLDCVDDGGDYVGTGGNMAYSNVAGTVGRADGHTSLPPYYFEGDMDDLMFWNRALSAAEVTDLCNRAFVTDVEEIKETGLTLFPNPTNDVVNFELKENSTVKVYDSMGKLVSSESLQVGQHTIDVSAFASGMYAVTYTTESGKTGTSQLMVE